MKGNGICLLSRREFKFVILLKDLPKLQSFLVGKAFKQETPTRIWNLVFDSEHRKNFDNYARARLRIYYQRKIKFPTEAYLEKRKSLWGKVTKERAKILLYSHGSYFLKNNSVAEKIFDWITKRKLKPLVVVDYKRNAFFKGKNRVTFDFDITYRAHAPFKCGPLNKILGKEKDCIVKVKYVDKEPPYWLTDFVCQRTVFVPRFSKVENAFKAMKEAKKQ